MKLLVMKVFEMDRLAINENGSNMKVFVYVRVYDWIKMCGVSVYQWINGVAIQTGKQGQFNLPSAKMV